MPRYKLLQVVDVALVAPAPVSPAEVAVAPVAKLDVTPEYSGVDADGNFSFSIPAYDAATHNQLVALHVSLYSKPHPIVAPQIPSDPAEIVKAALHFSTSTAGVHGPVTVDATSAPEGKYSAALVAEFDA